MNTREQLNAYLRTLERRLRWMAISRGVAVAAGVALGATVALVLITNALAFSEASLTWSRVILFLALAVALGYALVIPLTRLNRRRAAGRAEAVFPQFDQRLLTYVERSSSGDPMLELLAEDTQAVARKTVPHDVAPPRSIFAFATGAGAAGAVLLWLILAGPGYLGYGASLLWAGAPKVGGPTGAYYKIDVDPGNKLVRRNNDQPITATLSGFQAPQVRLFSKFKSSSKWETVNMLPGASSSAYTFLFTGVPEPVQYYVEAAGVKSQTFQLDVVDLPAITHITVTYHFPSWLGIKDQVEDPGGDLRAVKGTVAEVAVKTDRPLKNGIVEMEDGTHVALEERAGGMLVAKVPIQKDGLYHFAGMEQGQSVRLTADYFIEAQDDQAPTVRITHPPNDAKVNPVEEVTVTVNADDDFALQAMDLHYSVNGAPEKTVSLLPNKGMKSAEGKTMIALEDFKLEPGDVVSMYASAKDARTTSQTDIFFIQADNYERNYTQSQQGGGGGGGGGGGMQDQQEISRRQREIIAATYNAVRGSTKDRTATAENAQYLSETQKTLKQQAESLAQRATSRELAGANQEFQAFVNEMKAAATEMGTASDKLKGLQWKDAIPPEEKALQHLQRAESVFRDIQVAFGRNGGGGGGGGGANAGRDLANLFDLELDTEKNQYEQAQQASSSAEQRQKDIDDAMQKLSELARRQQELAQQNRNNKQQSIDQRWQQEQLRREAEELQKKLEQAMQQQQQSGQLSRNGSQSSQSSQSSQGSQSGQQSSQSGQQGQQSNQQRASAQGGASAQQLQRMLDQVKKAAEDMRQAQKASQQGNQNDSEAQARQRAAAERLQEALDSANSMRRQDASAQLGTLADRADKLASQQHDVENRMKQAFGDYQSQDPQQRAKAAQVYQGSQNRQANEQLAGEKDKMAAEIDALEKELRQASRNLQTTQPNASARLRDGLSELQQNEAGNKVRQAAGWIRNNQGPLITSREAPITRALDNLRDDVRQAQQALQNGNQQGAARNDQERQLQAIESMRAQLQRLQGGQQGGQQKGGQQQGGQQQGGQQQGGQQAGGQQGGQQQGGQQAGGQQGGGARNGGGQVNPNGGAYNGGAYNGGPLGPYGGYNGGYNYDPRLGPNRQYPVGIYDTPDDRYLNNPALLGRDIQRQLDQLRQEYKDDPDISRQIAALESEVRGMQVGDIASPELAQRIGRTVLPQLETLEVQLRRNMEEKGTGQARAGASDKVPPGYQNQVDEYFRNLSKKK